MQSTDIALGAGVGLIAKIVFDWLKNRSGNGNGDGKKNSNVLLVDALQKISYILEEVKKDTYTTRDDIKELKINYNNDIPSFKNILSQSSTVNTKMVIVLEEIGKKLDKII